MSADMHALPSLPLRLSFTGQLDWQAMLEYLSARSIKGVEHISGSVYRRTILVDGDPGAIEVRRGGPGHLAVIAHLPHQAGPIPVVDQVRRLFNLDFDLDAANAALGRDPVLAARIAALPGLRAAGSWDPFEVGVRAIVGQQVTVAGAGTIIARLVERHGILVPGLDRFGLSHVFPASGVLAEADLAGTGLTGARIAAIRNFASAVAAGSLRLDRTRRLDDLLASMLALPGLGPWTAQYVALRIGEADAFPSSDLGLRRSLEALTGRAMTPRAVGEMAERWRPWRAHAAIHLWTSSRRSD
ncbi:MAG TPA: AlkA N-terminal domain-containing protein [Candidatus Dormibacteraeota bacterium]|nr:AlkA N-terminal domain-containing protein [Candidatus Dormibacteraeota bacterium]